MIPVRCFTCGQILASKYKLYKENLKKINTNESNIMYFKKKNTDIYTKEMIKVGIKRYCCKRHFLGQLNILEKL